MTHAFDHFVPLGVAVLTISDSRTEATDTSGVYLKDQVSAMQHRITDYRIIPDEAVQIRAFIENFIDDKNTQVVLCTGGTGLRPRDVTPQIVEDLCDTLIPGFGEYFRYLSIDQIGSSTIQSRAIAGMSGQTLIACLPGSTGACKTAWEGILRFQLDATNRPCNFVEVLINGESA